MFGKLDRFAEDDLKSVLLLNALLLCCCFPSAILGQATEPPAELTFRFEMNDATIVYGSPNLERIEMDLEFDQISIPIDRVQSIKQTTTGKPAANIQATQPNTQTFIIVLKNNDRYSGRILNQPFDVQFVAGKVTLPFSDLKSADSSTSPQSFNNIQAGPIFHFNFEGSSKSTEKNRVANQFHLAVNNVERVAKSRFRKGVKLDGTKTMSIGHDPRLCPQKFTISAWIKPTGNRNNYAFIFGKSKPSTWDGGFAFVYMNNDPTHVHFYVNGYQNQVARATIKSDRWSHLTGTCDGKALVLYLDGKEVHRTKYPAGVPINHTQDPLTIGGDASAYRWTGELDEAYMFNYALSPTQVKALFDRHVLP